MSFSNLIKRVSMLCLISMVALVSFAQSQTVKGVVTDDLGEPMIGVNVSVKGTTNGAVTDLDGNYSLQNVNSSDVLVFTFIGYTSKEVSVGNQTTINMQMSEDRQALDEVVVIGYQTVRRRDLTGAVASVKGNELAQNPVSNVAQALQGKLPGVNVVSADGRPGATINVRVRGGGSITQSNDPLFIVDGFPVSSIDNIPANEIESIDVLKDASSTAIYGARGANGVILVTTKGAKEGKVKISYDGYFQTKSVANTLETLSAQDYVLHTWSYATSRSEAAGNGIAEYFGLGSKYGNHYADYANMKYHDYTDDLLRTAISHNHNVTISGGNENTKAIVTFGYMDDEGIKINSGADRMNFSLKVNQKLAKNLTFDADLRFSENNLLGNEGASSGHGSDISGAYMYKPIDNPRGTIDANQITGIGFGVQNIDDAHNPVEVVNDVISKSKSQQLRASAALTWEIISGLTARTELSLSRNTNKNIYYKGGYQDGGIKSAQLSRGVGEGLRSVTTLNYNKTFGKIHNISLLAGNEVITSNSETTNLDGRGYSDSFDYKQAIAMIHAATISFNASNNEAVPARTVSFFGRANYTLMDRYLFTATFRADGSSKFAPNNRWGYFPAAAVAWRISEEGFMKDIEDVVDNLKLRLSYGTSGADNINSNLWRETWTSTSGSRNNMPINGQLGWTYYKPAGMLANADLKWETTVSRNIGVDFGFWKSRLNGSLEVYWNTTKDLLMAVPTDNTTGYAYQFQNFGKTSNRGFELSLNYDVVRTKDFRFNVTAIYNYNKNKLDELANADQYLYSSYAGSSFQTPTNDYMLEEGKSIGIVRGYKDKGLYTTADFDYTNGQYVLKAGIPDLTSAVTDTYNNPFNLPAGQVAFPGAPKFEDIDGNGKIDLDDATCLGEVMPHHTGSFSLNFTYKDFDLSANFNWVADGKVYNANSMFNSSGLEFNSISAGRLAWVADAYKVYNVNSSGELYAVTDANELNSLNAHAKYALPYHKSMIVSDRWLESGAYLRLQNITLGYTLPKELTNKAKIERVRFYVTGTNLFTITNYSGVDPEVNATPTGRAGFLSDLRIFPTPNMDYGAYPRARTFTIGANISF